MPPEPHKPETVMDPQAEAVAKIYAQALLDQVPSDPEAEELAGELDALVGLLDGIDGFEELMTAALPSQKDRLELVQRIFHGRVDEPVEGLLAVMADANRLGLLRQVRRVYRSLVYLRQGKLEVTVTTAVALDDDQRQRVREVLAEALGSQVVVRMLVEASIVGGMVMRIGDEVYDASIRSELVRIQGRLAAEIDLPPLAMGVRKAPGVGQDSKTEP